jgi:hypothetical protein
MESGMSELHCRTRVDDPPFTWTSPSEGQSHTEHRAALDATLFRAEPDPDELVLELEAGELRLLPDPSVGGR